MKEVKKFFKEKNQKYRTEDYFSNLFSKHFEDNYKALNDLLSTELAESKVQPVQLKSMGHKKMTLLLDLDETLVHCFGDMDHSKPHQRKIIITQPDGTMVKVRFFENFLRQN
jgi:TFIIF-interacting CTD phosphatase-like protein